MRTLLSLTLALAGAGAAWCTAANAGTYVIEESQSRYIACYNQVYVPAKIQVNTRGKLVRPYSQSWEVAGSSWNYVRNVPVYIQTTRIVEPDHYTLVPSSCGPKPY